MLVPTVRLRMPGPPEASMQAIANPAAWPAWRPGLLRVTSISEQPIQSASAWVEEWDLDGRTIRLLSRTTEVDVPRAFSYIARGDGFVVVFRWQAMFDGESTFVTRDATISATGLRNLASRAALRFARQQDSALIHLRKALRGPRGR